MAPDIDSSQESFLGMLQRRYSFIGIVRLSEEVQHLLQHVNIFSSQPLHHL
jgi:hypothetical protein